MTRIVSLVCMMLLCSASCISGPKVPVQITSVTIIGSLSPGLPATLTANGQGFCPLGALPQVIINGTNLAVGPQLCSNTSVTASLPLSFIATCDTLTITNSASGSASGGDGGGSNFGASGAQPGKNGYSIVTLAPTPGLLLQ